MKVRIYQIDLELDVKNIAFRSLDCVLKAYNGCVPEEIYNCVFDGDLKVNGLEDVFRIFNNAFPKDYQGRSLSVSDVVELQNTAESKFYFCEFVGFRQIEFSKCK